MSIAFVGLTLVDNISKSLIEDARIIVNGTKIERVITDPNEPIPNNISEIVDCKGKFVLPGLIDVHVHLHKGKQHGDWLRSSEASGEPSLASEKNLVSRLHSYLFCGVTSIFDAGNFANKLYFLRRAEQEGRILSPRIFCAGSFVTCPGGHGSPLSVDITSMPQDVEKLSKHLENRPDIVKITYDERNWGMNPLIPILDPRTLKSIIDYCHSMGFRVTVHVSSELRSREAIESGADTLAHTVIQSPITSEFAELVCSKKKKIPLASTMQIGESYSRLAEHPEYLNEQLYQDCIDEEERSYLYRIESGKQKESRQKAWMNVMTPVLGDNIRLIHGKGGIIATGSDGSSGPDYVRELELLQEFALSPWDVIVAATHSASIFLGKGNLLGTIREGALADFIVLDDDPTLDVENLRRVSLVIKDGRIVDRTKLDLPINRRTHS